MGRWGPVALVIYGSLACMVGSTPRETPAPEAQPPIGAEERAKQLMVDPKPYGPVSLWKQQLEAGCTAEQWSSFGRAWPDQVVRIVRHAPYALRGRVIEPPELSDFFSRQPWYLPSDDAPMPPASEVECAGRLESWEQKRRAEHPIPADLEARLWRERFFEVFFRSPDAFALWPTSGQPFEHNGELWWCEQPLPEPIDGIPCSGGLRCPTDRPCELSSGL